jgi:quinol monooxygenase YgiN
MGPDAVHWIAVFAIHEGRTDEFRGLAERTAALVRETEPGQLRYRWHMSPDGSTCLVDAWYADADAALAHLGGRAVAELLPSVLAVSELAEIRVLSDVRHPGLREALAGFGATFWDGWTGFDREAVAGAA